MSVVLKGSHLRKSFIQHNEEVIIIENLTIEIPTNRFIAIMGSSGAGKSTLLYLLSGLDEPTIGIVQIAGVTLNCSDERLMTKMRREKIGFVFQDNNLMPNLTLEENILVAGYLSNSERKEIQQRAEDLMDRLGISAMYDRFPSEVSGGQKQRCAIVRALINNPDVIFADEPTGNLNSAVSKEVMECFVATKEEGQSILMVTHDPKSAIYADQVLFMRDGDIIDTILFEDEQGLEDKHDQLIAWLKEHNW